MGQEVKSTNDRVVELVKSKQKSYKSRAYFWLLLHYLLGVLSASLAAVLASGAINEPSCEQLIALAVAISAGVSTFLRPDARAKQFNAARSLLRRARNQHDFDNHPLTKALNDADEIISAE
ncbi:hypothetical protein HRH59_05975 [Rheinheimera sp. YQF-2]|uniref:SMODS and SLOG-associating 2TM effector domain-containing protein n=1 Tax=Rheinheimera lutimaris TaxID=2740584 RepID=A0A7Y5APF9_9GAMM|nr:hypothetical protein [Rheinheimera lutimaris]NRQ42117.1 hypothetical protein [Rheinheimera lutimaris]